MNVRPATPLLVTLVTLVTLPARGATEYPDPYSCTTVKGSCTGTDARYPVQYKSLYDGAKDRYYLRFPDTYDKNKAYPLFVHFHAWCAGDSSIADPRMLRQVANDNQVIFVGHWQRGGTPDCGTSFLGDGKKESPAAAAAAKKDVGELLNEMVSRFKINYVIAAGSSMGGYVALRMPTVFPDKVHVVMATATALQKGHSTFPEPTAILNAAKAGLLTQRFVYNVIGTADSQFISVNRELNTLMKGKPYWSYHEVSGVGHSNFFADDWNYAKGYCSDPNLASSHCWYVSTKATPGLWSGVSAWKKTHASVVNSLLKPDCNWKAPAKMADWYITQDLYNRGGRAGPHVGPGCGKNDAGPKNDGPGPKLDGPKKDGPGPKLDGPKKDKPKTQHDGPGHDGTVDLTVDGGGGTDDKGSSCSCDLGAATGGRALTVLLLVAVGLLLARGRNRF